MKRLACLLGSTLLAACAHGPTPPPPPGAIAVAVVTRSAVDNPLFTFGVVVDNGTPISVSSAEHLNFVAAGLTAGKHVVALRQLPAGCGAGTDSRELSLRGGDTVTVFFAVRCERTTGDLVLNTVTTGVELDPDGYAVTINGAARGTVSANGTMTVRNLAPGSHLVELAGLAANCAAVGAAAQAVDLVAGAAVSIEKNVTCRPTTGTLRLVTATAGTDLDPDGYVITLDEFTLRLHPNRTAVFGRYTPGDHQIAIADVEENCVLAGSVSRSFSLAAGDTVTVAMQVTCAAVGPGVAGFSAADPAADTMPATAGSSARAHDLVAITGRYTPDFLLLTLRFSANISAPARHAANSVYGFIDLDVDESAATGVEPGINIFGGNAEQGIEYEISLFGGDETSVELYGLDGSLGRVAVRFDGDSVTIRVPLSKLGRDDGNLSLTAVFGTYGRATDVAPNTGVVLARRPAAVAAAVAPPAATLQVHPGQRISETRPAVKWPRWP